MGDPAGIGPEIVLKALGMMEVYDLCRPIVIGDAKVLIEACHVSEGQSEIRAVKDVVEAEFRYGTIDILDLDNVPLDALKIGRVQRLAGKASYEYIEKAVKLALKKEIDAIATAPISKEALNLAGYDYPGHTEILAELTGAKEYAMMYVTPHMNVILATVHMSLKEACESIRKEKVLPTIKLAHQALKKLGVKEPRIAVAGLNPHAGEGGLFGREEIDEIKPAIEAAKALGLQVSGPYPPDTVFYRVKKGEFDIVVSMYHDQGSIPIKLLDFEVGVNVTVGLPIIRTSVDHGTAFDIAASKRGTANPQSLVEAIKLAAQMAGGQESSR